jgi:putative transcriptional regulator
MAIVKRRNGKTKTKGRVNPQVLLAATELDKERWDIEDGVRDEDFGPWRFVPPKVDVSALREKLHLSQEAFARRFCLPLRTIQEWEQQRREPSEPARVLLYAISQDPMGVQAALRGGKRVRKRPA